MELKNEEILKNGVIRNYLEPYLKKMFEANAVINPNRQIGKLDKKIPYVTEEAAFNSLLTGCIHQYIVMRQEYSSFVISEGIVKRRDIVEKEYTGRCDIVWYINDIVFYIELKGAIYKNDTGDWHVKTAENACAEARKQIDSIVKSSHNDTAQVPNEDWYNFKPGKRYGCYLTMIYSTINSNKESNFAEIKQSLKKTENAPDILVEQHFDQFALVTDSKKKYDTDGYFVVGNIFPI